LDDYYGKLDSILNDKTKFAKVIVNTKTHPLIAIELALAFHVLASKSNLLMRIAQVFSDHGCFSLQNVSQKCTNGGENKLALRSYMLTCLN